MFQFQDLKLKSDFPKVTPAHAEPETRHLLFAGAREIGQAS